MTLNQLLVDAAKVIDSAGKSLAAVKHHDKLVQTHKAEVVTLLRNLDSRVGQLSRLLPQRQPEMTPVFIDAGKVHSLPIELLAN